jgi:chemotaxis protein methyltransferase CheR
MTAEDHALTLLAMLIERQTGMYHGPRDRPILYSKLRDHAEAQGYQSFLEFYRSVEYDDPGGERFSALVDAVVVGETYFFRERPALDWVVGEVARRAAAGLHTRVWSAAAATGEEIFSLAALLAERGVLDRAELLAADLSARHVARGQAGEHTRRALRLAPDGMPPWIRQVDGRAMVDPDLRRRVAWRRVNLLDADAVRALGRFDVILCRNVLIYFDDATVERVVGQLSDALVPGGTLLVGTSESLLRFSTELVCAERGGVFVYQKPVART